MAAKIKRIEDAKYAKNDLKATNSELVCE